MQVPNSSAHFRSIRGSESGEIRGQVFPRWLRVSLLALTGLRLAVAARVPLSPDEAYYWVWSKALSPGYLDHPPMVALWIRLGTLVAGDTPLGVRLLGPFSALLGTLLLMRAAEDFWPGCGAGVKAACLLNATLALNVGAVVMTPDTPLLFFWTAGLAALARLVSTGQAAWWLAFGGLAGCALDSKYTAAFLGAGVLAWMLFIPPARRWFSRWQVWAAGALAAGCFAPVVVWNAAHGWASFAKQGGRTGDWQPSEAVRFLSEFLLGQLGLATPWVGCLFVSGMVLAASGFMRRELKPALLACLTVLPASVFLEHALGGRVQANWPAVIFPGAALAASAAVSRWWQPAAMLGLALSAGVFWQASVAPLALPRGLDFTLIRMGGWTDLAGQIFVAAAKDHAAFVASEEYGLSAEMAFRLHGEVDSTDPRWRFFDIPHVSLAGRAGMLILSDRDAGTPDPHLWASPVLETRVARARHGVVAETYRLYRVVGLTGAEAARLPSPQKVTGKLGQD
jgi:4-amino-4-deoxy-L-arabinose transferase-like glycosyltransferase